MQKKKRIQYITQLINTSPFKFSFINRTSCHDLSLKYTIYIYIYILFYKIILYLKANEWYFPFWFLGGGRGIGRECLVFDCVKDYFVNVDNFLAYKN